MDEEIFPDRIERRFSLSFYYFFSPLAVIPHTYVICHRPRITCVARLDWRVNFASASNTRSRDGENLENLDADI